VQNSHNSLKKRHFSTIFAENIWKKSQKGVYLQRQKSQKGV